VTVLVATETLLLVLLAILVVGLLRSHAEILRRLGPPEGEAARASGPRPPGELSQRGRPTRAADIAGSTLDGTPIQVGVRPGGPSTLLAFLSSGCLTCRTFWESLGSDAAPAVPGGARLVAVTKDRDLESPARLRDLAPADVPLVMSSAAWRDYEVPTSPYFVYVDGGSGEVHGEGAASGWEQVASLLRDALDDAATAERAAASGATGPERASRIDRELAEAGIGPGHESLYPERDREGKAAG
jgi:hypothetical protein